MKENKQFVNNWARAEKLSLEIYQEIAGCNSEETIKKYKKIEQKIKKLWDINYEIIKSLNKPIKIQDDQKLKQLKKKYNKKQNELKGAIESKAYSEEYLDKLRTDIYKIELQITKLDDKWSIY